MPMLWVAAPFLDIDWPSSGIWFWALKPHPLMIELWSLCLAARLPSLRLLVCLRRPYLGFYYCRSSAFLLSLKGGLLPEVLFGLSSSLRVSLRVLCLRLLCFLRRLGSFKVFPQALDRFLNRGFILISKSTAKVQKIFDICKFWAKKHWKNALLFKKAHFFIFLV